MPLRGDQKQLLTLLKRIGQADSQRLLRPLAEEMLTRTKLRFKNQVDPSGQPWKPLAPSTLASRRRGNGRGGALILIDTGDLRNSISYKIDATRLILGTNKKYARIQQKGGMAGRGHKVNIPARPFLGFNASDRDYVQKAVNAWLRGQL